MSSTLQVTVQSTLAVAETFSGGLQNANVCTFAPLNETLSLNAGTTPPATKHATGSKALVSGAGTLNLTALPGITGDETVNGTGLSVQVAKFENPIANANAITITFGASNPYLLLGSAWKITLAPGQSTGPMNFDGGAPTIATGARDIDLAGTGTQALNYHFIFG